jgi:hypothetical protein
LIGELKTQATVKKFLPMEFDPHEAMPIVNSSEKNKYLICAEKDGFLEVIDTETQKMVFIGQLRSKIDVFDICKTTYHPNEYAVALGQYGGGLFFIELVRDLSKDG